MPIVAHNELPTFERLRQEGQTILDPDRAMHQYIRDLHIGLLNMMPDAAIAATERQFYRLVGESNPIAQFYLHPFTLKELPRGEPQQERAAGPERQPGLSRGRSSVRGRWMPRRAEQAAFPFRLRRTKSKHGRARASS